MHVQLLKETQKKDTVSTFATNKIFAENVNEFCKSEHLLVKISFCPKIMKNLEIWIEQKEQPKSEVKMT